MLSPATFLLNVKSLHSKCGVRTHAPSYVHTTGPPAQPLESLHAFHYRHGTWAWWNPGILPPTSPGCGKQTPTWSARSNHSPEQKRGQSSCGGDSPLCHPLPLDSPGLPWTESISRSTRCQAEDGVSLSWAKGRILSCFGQVPLPCSLMQNGFHLPQE